MDHWISSLTAMLGASLFYQLSAMLIASGVIGFIALRLRQPLIVAFIGVGLAIGPDVLGFIPAESSAIDTLAQLGIALLLFLVGLKLDITLIKALGPVALVTGIAQVILTAGIGFGLALWLGYTPISAVWIGTALAFSSTIIAVKLLSDSGAIESLYGKICLGILIVQDLAFIVAMVVVTAMDGEMNSGPAGMMIAMDIALKLGVLIVVTATFIRYIATPLTHQLARAPELMVIFAVGLAATMAAICYALDLSKELGGLLAGIALASTPLRDVIASRLSPIRDFLLLFFFINLGIQLDLDGLEAQIVPALAISAFVLIGKPIIIMAIMGFMGHRRRASFLAGLTLCQISEFSMIFASILAVSGMMLETTVTMLTLVGMITITVSVYAITYQEKLYLLLERALGIFERRQPNASLTLPDKKESYEVIIYGMGRFGLAMAREFRKSGASVLGIDFDPDAIKAAHAEGIPAIYGDAGDAEFPKSLALVGSHAIVMAFPHHITAPLMPDVRRTLARSLRQVGYRGHIAATSHFRAGQESLLESGIDIVLCPFEDAATRGADMILAAQD